MIWFRLTTDEICLHLRILLQTKVLICDDVIDPAEVL